jgi:DNA-binding Lrp family transcriptional regulator
MSYHPDAKDRALLEQIQGNVPLEPDIWDSIGRQVGLSGTEVLQRLRTLRDEKILRSIGPVIEPDKVGLKASSLVALRVPPERLREVAMMVNEYPEVSHNYRRNHPYNLWFTLTAPSWEELKRVREEIRMQLGLEEKDVLDLPRKKRFKIGVRFHITRPEERDQ